MIFLMTLKELEEYKIKKYVLKIENNFSIIVLICDTC